MHALGLPETMALRCVLLDLMLAREYTPKHTIDELLAQLTIVFLQTPVARCPKRSVPRTKLQSQRRHNKPIPQIHLQPRFIAWRDA